MGWRKKGGVKWVVHILHLNCDVYSLSLSLWFHIFRQQLHSERERNLLFCINCKVYIHVHNVILYNHFFSCQYHIFYTLFAVVNRNDQRKKKHKKLKNCNMNYVLFVLIVTTLEPYQVYSLREHNTLSNV